MADRPDVALRPPLPVSTYTAAIRADADLLASAAASAGPDARVPTCPAWNVRQLTRHLGGVHRWATEFVATGRTTPNNTGLERLSGGWPSDDDLGSWFLDGAARLADALDAADPELRCWTFLRATSPRLMWARRQAHETAIHRVDAEVSRAGPRADEGRGSAAGGGATATPFDPTLAADGIDELLACFITHGKGKLNADPPRTLRVTTIDADGDWDVVVGPATVTTLPGGSGPPDATVTGAASDLYQALWNRPPQANLDTRGDPSVLALFLDEVKVRW